MPNDASHFSYVPDVLAIVGVVVLLPILLRSAKRRIGFRAEEILSERQPRAVD